MPVRVPLYSERRRRRYIYVEAAAAAADFVRENGFGRILIRAWLMMYMSDYARVEEVGGGEIKSTYCRRVFPREIV